MRIYEQIHAAWIRIFRIFQPVSSGAKSYGAFLKSIHYNRSQIANARTLHKGNGRAFAVISTVTLQHGLIAEKQYRRKQEHGLLIWNLSYDGWERFENHKYRIKNEMYNDWLINHNVFIEKDEYWRAKQWRWKRRHIIRFCRVGSIYRTLNRTFSTESCFCLARMTDLTVRSSVWTTMFAGGRRQTTLQRGTLKVLFIGLCKILTQNQGWFCRHRT